MKLDLNNIPTYIIILLVGIVLSIITIKLIKKEKTKSIIDKIIYILYILIVVISLQKIIFKDNRMLFFYFYKVSSGSMEKTLHVNDYILVMESNNYKAGDIITFRNNKNKIITHRIVSVNNNEIVTKGDANLNVDKTIYKDQIIGKVILHGLFLNLYMDYIGYIIIVYSTSYIVIGLFKQKE